MSTVTTCSPEITSPVLQLLGGRVLCSEPRGRSTVGDTVGEAVPLFKYASKFAELIVKVCLMMVNSCQKKVSENSVSKRIWNLFFLGGLTPPLMVSSSQVPEASSQLPNDVHSDVSTDMYNYMRI